MPGSSIRDGRPADLAALCKLEVETFATDRLSARSFRRFISSHATRLRLSADSGELRGYSAVMTRAGSRVARLYSLAVAAEARGQGLGEKLLSDAERIARQRGADVLRLEVRADNAPAIRLYERRGYVRIGTYRQYYADKADALRYERRLRPTAKPDRQADNDEDRSPADFGVSSPLMKTLPPYAPARVTAAPAQHAIARAGAWSFEA